VPFSFPYLAPLTSQPGFISRASTSRFVEIERCALDPAAVPAGHESVRKGGEKTRKALLLARNCTSSE
jgi:hypothetical protein